MEENIQLVVSDFSKRYGNSHVYSVKDVNITVNGGEVFGFIGHNGAGKSTTIKSIVGIQPITKGKITICGYDISKDPLNAKLNIGYMSDNHASYEKLTGRKYVMTIAKLFKMNEKEAEERMIKLADMFNLTDALDRHIEDYSHGMKQKLAIIQALVHKPKLWVLDEPLTGLDPISVDTLKTLMREYANEGNIVFFSSHIIEVVEKICDKIAIIRKGHIECAYSMNEIREQGISLEELYMKYVGGDSKAKEDVK